MIDTDTINSLKTICGGIHYSLIRYHRIEIDRESRDWELLTSHLNIPQDTIYNIEINARGFILNTRHLSLRFFYSNFTEKRIVELDRNETG